MSPGKHMGVRMRPFFRRLEVPTMKLETLNSEELSNTMAFKKKVGPYLAFSSSSLQSNGPLPVHKPTRPKP